MGCFKELGGHLIKGLGFRADVRILAKKAPPSTPERNRNRLNPI